MTCTEKQLWGGHVVVMDKTELDALKPVKGRRSRQRKGRRQPRGKKATDEVEKLNDTAALRKRRELEV